MDCLSRYVDPIAYCGVLGMATDIRLQSQPNPAQAGVDNMAGYVNPLVVGGLQLSLGIVTTEEDALARLSEVREERRPPTPDPRPLMDGAPQSR
jgi:hypothetical protein